MITEKKIYELHHENQEWLKSLSFYKEELTSMQSRIEDVASKNTSKEFQAMVDHYLNQFEIQKSHINHLKHDIKSYENILEVNVEKNPTAADHRSLPDEVEQREKMNRFEELFAELRDDVNKFLARVL